MAVDFPPAIQLQRSRHGMGRVQNLTRVKCFQISAEKGKRNSRQERVKHGTSWLREKGGRECLGKVKDSECNED
jgi:hypothetical protein